MHVHVHVYYITNDYVTIATCMYMYMCIILLTNYVTIATCMYMYMYMYICTCVLYH